MPDHGVPGHRAEDGLAFASDGTPLAYRRIAGQGQQRCALLHSLAMDMGFWDRVLPRLLPAAAEVLVMDCRGHGRSGTPPGPYSVELMADDLASVMDAIGWDRAVVAGASMGGCVALGFAARHPGRLSGLGLFDTTACYGEDAPARWEERGQKGLREGLAQLIPFQAERWFGPAFRAAHPEVLEAAIRVFGANDPHAYLASCRMLGAADLRAALPHIAVPTEVLVGEEDYATPPSMAKALADGIPGARLTVLPGMRHLTPLESPFDVVAALARLMAQAKGVARR